MRKGLLLCGALALATPVQADAPKLDETLMETIEIVNESLSSNLGLKQAAAAVTDAQDLDALFADVEAYFVQRGDAEDGVAYARKSRDATASILKALGDTQFDAASNLAVEISRTCKACHRKYKPD